nr:FAD-binding protein [Gemmatimonadaceae bacterium]
MIDGATATIAEQVREARNARTPLRIVGRGGWLDAGAPVSATNALDVGQLRGLVEYEPGDLVLTAQSGTSLDEIAAATNAHGQWVPLDPFGTNDGSLGATIATASFGPLATAYGTPRDHVLGARIVTGAGETINVGGRVVKNVAGFDLTRLSTGAWGTLGVFTQVTVRVRALPARDRSIAIELADTPGAVDAAWHWLRNTPHAPLAAELVDPARASALGLRARTVMLLRVGGNDAAVRAAVDDALQVGPADELPAQIWTRLRAGEPRGVTVRASTLPSRIESLWARCRDAVSPWDGTLCASLPRGVVRCAMPPGNDAEVV